MGRAGPQGGLGAVAPRRGARLRTPDRSPSRSAHPPRPHPGDERRLIPPETHEGAPPAAAHPRPWRRSRTRRDTRILISADLPIPESTTKAPFLIGQTRLRWPTFAPPSWPAFSPPLTGVCEAFVKTFKCDHARVNPRPDDGAILHQLPVWFEDYNAVHLHSGLRMRSPREFITSRSPTAAECPD